MSEYQYYEFQAVDRPLTGAELEQVRALSSRARISSTHFVNEYHFGDFRGDPRTLVERFYDAHLYWANWGHRRLMLRLPTSLLPRRAVEPYLDEDVLAAWTKSGHTLLDFQTPYQDDSGEWDWEQSFSLSSLLGLRTELASGDLRPLYLAWLVGLRHWELTEDGDEEDFQAETEPPVPAGLGELSGPQRALAELLELDADLLAAAAQASPAAATLHADHSDHADHTGLAEWIAALPAEEKDRLLLDAATGRQPHPGPALLARHRAARKPAGTPSAPRRSAAELLDAAHELRTARRHAERAARAAARRERAEAETQAREAHLTRIAADPQRAWADIDELIARKQQPCYDAAVTLLRDLRELHDRADDRAGFDSRAGALREAHRGKPSLMRRFDEAGFPNP